MTRMKHRLAAVVILLTIGMLPLQAAAQTSTSREQEPGKEVITPGPDYGAGWIYRLFFGHRYRDLWTTPIEVEVLDLSRFAGGLTPLRAGGGHQTKSLRMASGDGREFTFRSVDKDPSILLPEQLLNTLVHKIVQDQMSSNHPAGALVAAPLLEATGVLHAEPRLVLMPDDERLGEFRETYGGMFGLIEIRPTEGEEGAPGFGGSEDIKGTPDLFELMEEGPENRIDARTFLTARLVDLYLGDWDRHEDQWRWARYGDDPYLWEPIPRDRDQAFSGWDGFLIWIASFSNPQFVTFDDDISRVYGLVWSSNSLDHRVLTELEKSVWDSTVARLQAQLTDSVIENAVRRLPAEMYPGHGIELERLLKSRRDHLDDAAEVFYTYINKEADIHTTDRSEGVEIRRVDDEVVEVRVRDLEGRRGAIPEAPYLSRRFFRSETDEIRIYLHGGDDTVTVTGEVDHSIRVRVMSGGGDDRLIDRSVVRNGPKQTLFYDHRGDDEIESGRETRTDTRPPARDWMATEFIPSMETKYAEAQDWGNRWLPLIWSYYSSDLGVFLGTGLIYNRFGFRRDPYLYQLKVKGGYSTTRQAARLEMNLDIPQLFRRVDGGVEVRASGIEVLNYHGLGNETTALESKSHYEIEQREISVWPSLRFELSEKMHLYAGLVLKGVETTVTIGSYLDQALVAGHDAAEYSGSMFNQAGALAGLTFSSRDRPSATTNGYYLDVQGTFYPASMSVEEPLTALDAEAATYLSFPLPGDPVVALRAGGRKVWGRFPMHEAAFLGGVNTLQGFRRQRFAGDAALFGNAELRLYLSRFFVILPGDFGCYFSGDGGRVYLDGNTSDTWHTSLGGGLWFAFLERVNTIRLGFSQSREDTRFYIQGGFMF